MSISAKLENEPQEITRHPKPAALIDLDGTLYPGLIMENIIEEQMSRGLISSLASVTNVWDAILDYRNGRQGYDSNVIALNSGWATACQGIHYVDLFNHAREFVRENKEKFYPYADPVFQHLKKKGYDTWLLTAEPYFVAHAVALEFGATGFCATEWQVGKQGKITGGIKHPMTGQEKGQWAEFIFHHPIFGYDRTRSIAIIDSVNDRELADAVPLSVVCEPANPDLIKHLVAKGRHHFITPCDDMVKSVDRLTYYPDYEKSSCRNLNRI